MDEFWIQPTVERFLGIFPWYGPLLAEKGLDRHSIKSVNELPLLTSELLERYYYGADQPFGELDGVTSYRTSGTSSLRRKTIYYSNKDEEQYIGIKTDIFRRILIGSGVATALSDMGTGHAASTALDIFGRIGMTAESIDFKQPIEQHLAKLRELRPHILYTMPSLLDRLLSATMDDPTSYGIRQVILVGEIASPAWIKSVAHRLGIVERDITDTYGSIEIGTIAFYSHEYGRYLFAEGIEAEGVGVESLFVDTEPLKMGESVLVLTSLVRDLFPALRYVTYDVVRDLRPILVDGQWRQSFEAIVRRIGPELKHGEKISVYDIEDVVYRHLNDARVRIHVHANKLSVHVDSKDKNPELYKRIERELSERIPEIGIMIQGGMLEAMQVIPSDVRFDDTVLKHKKIFYGGVE
ncbi:CoF synthetase [Cohnella luojiensis]|uniref:CoF synthetase n=1 Tax=Cohnella luojiensis TaxID=652876 RepID=A0A4Y8LXY3_9BACL|nr:CoF synthetase [Cohnella luojiensis]TFE26099.1 CoF synthetase [Cohnella luojiensis]